MLIHSLSTNTPSLTVPLPSKKITRGQFFFTHSLLVVGTALTYFEGWGVFLAMVFYFAHMLLDVHQSAVQAPIRLTEPPTARIEGRRTIGFLLFWGGIVVALCLVGKFIPLSWFYHSGPNVKDYDTMARIWRHPVTIVITWCFVLSYLRVMWNLRVDHGSSSAAELKPQ